MQEAKEHRGFALLDPEKRREIARKGGASQRPENRTFSRNRELASSAGRKGGAARKGYRKMVVSA